MAERGLAILNPNRTLIVGVGNALVDILAHEDDAFLEKHQVKLGFMGFFVRASVEALQSFPDVNAYIEGDEIVYHNYCDVGVAVSTPKGLMVPVIRDADKMSLAQIEKQILAYSAKARENKIGIDDLSGGTFTVSNLGMFGVDAFTAIINPPEGAILAVGGVHSQLVPVGGGFFPRSLLKVTLSADHRAIDGILAARFLARLKSLLESGLERF